MLNILHPRNPRELQAAKRRHFLDLVPTNGCQPRPSLAKPATNQSGRGGEEEEEETSTHTLLHPLHILKTDPDPPRASQMPPRLPRQVLHHDPAEHDKLGVDAVQQAVVGQVEAVGDFDGEPGCLGLVWFVRTGGKLVCCTVLYMYLPKSLWLARVFSVAAWLAW